MGISNKNEEEILNIIRLSLSNDTSNNQLAGELQKIYNFSYDNPQINGLLGLYVQLVEHKMNEMTKIDIDYWCELSNNNHFTLFKDYIKSNLNGGTIFVGMLELASPTGAFVLNREANWVQFCIQIYLMLCCQFLFNQTAKAIIIKRRCLIGHGMCENINFAEFVDFCDSWLLDYYDKFEDDERVIYNKN